MKWPQKPKQNRRMKTQTGITDNNRKAVADELAKVLADETVLYTKTKKARKLNRELSDAS